MASDGAVIFSTEIDESGIKRGLTNLEKTTSKWGGSWSKAFVSTASKAARGFGVALAGASAGFGALAKVGLQYNSQMEDYQTNFSILLGDEARALDYVAQMREKAAKTPFGMEDLASASQTMLSFGLSAEDSMKYMDMLGDISLGNAEKLSSLSLAFSQVSSAGKLTGQDLLQMINAGFNPLQTIADQTGASLGDLKEVMSGGKGSKEFQKMVKDAQKEVDRLGDDASDSAKMLAQIGREGMISADMVGRAMEIETAEGGRFYQGMLKASETRSGMISTLKDDAMNLVGNVFAPLSASFKENVLPLASSYLSSLVDAFEQGGTDALVEEIGIVIGDVLSRATEAIPSLGVVATNLITNITKSISKNAPKIAKGMASSLSAIVKVITAAFPEIIQAISDSFPELIPVLADGISELLFAAVTNVDEILLAGASLAKSLVSSVVKALPRLGQGLLDALVAIFSNSDEIAERSSSILNQYFGDSLSAYEAYKKGIAKVDTDYETVLTETETRKQTAMDLLDYYDQLNSMELKTDDDMALLAATAQQVVDLFPGLAAYIDPVTGAFNANTREIRNNIEALADHAIMQGKLQWLTEMSSQAAGMQIELGDIEKDMSNLGVLAQGYADQMAVISDINDSVYGDLSQNAQSLYDSLFAIDPQDTSNWQHFFTVTEDGLAAINSEEYSAETLQTGLQSALAAMYEAASIEYQASILALSSMQEQYDTILADLETTQGRIDAMKEALSAESQETQGDMMVTRAAKTDIRDAESVYEKGASSVKEKALAAKAKLRAEMSLADEAESALGSGLTFDYSDSGEQMAETLAQGIQNGSGSVQSAMTKVANRAKTAAQAAANAFSSIGSQMVNGVSSGIRNNIGILVDAVEWMVDRALDAAEKRAQIHSPSRLFQERIGAQLPSGAAVGVDENAHQLRDAVDRMITSSLPDMANYGGGLGSWSSLERAVAAGTFNQTNNFNVPVQTPDEFAQTMHRYATYGLAGG